MIVFLLGVLVGPVVAAMVMGRLLDENYVPVRNRLLLTKTASTTSGAPIGVHSQKYTTEYM